MINQVIQYLYYSDYNDDATETSPMLLNVRMVALAERYLIPHLTDIAVRKLDHHIRHDNGWATEAFTDAIEEAYSQTPDTTHQLHNTLMNATLRHVRTLSDMKADKHIYFRNTAKRTPSFAAELAFQLANKSEDPEVVICKCPTENCDQVFMSSVDHYE